MDYPVPRQTTEWEDALRKHGILPALPKVPTKDEIDEVAREAAVIAEQQAMEAKTLDELDELEDELDELVLDQYRKKRLEEMMAKAKAEKFGEVTEISKPDFVTEVTKASEQCWVLCHLYKDSIPACQVLNEALKNFARRFKAVKVVKIRGDLCIEGYPDANMPTLVIYHEGKVVKQLVGLQELAGLRTTDRDVEWYLASIGAVETDLEAPPKHQTMHRGQRRNVSDDDDDL